MPRRTFAAVACTAALCGALAPAHAGPITSVAFSGSETVIDFNGFPVGAGTPPTGPFTVGGVTFTESSTGSGAPGWRTLDFGDAHHQVLTDNAGISHIFVDLSTAYERIGLETAIG